MTVVSGAFDSSKCISSGRSLYDSLTGFVPGKVASPGQLWPELSVRFVLPNPFNNEVNCTSSVSENCDNRLGFYQYSTALTLTTNLTDHQIPLDLYRGEVTDLHIFNFLNHCLD